MTTKYNPIRALLRLAVPLLVLGIAGCSKSYSPTQPSSGSGGTRFNLGPFAVGQSAQLTFPSAGTNPYHCITHRSMGMTGTVQVDAAGADSQVVQLTAGSLFAPVTAHVKPGGHVRWVNASSRTDHTVTSDD